MPRRSAWRAGDKGGDEKAPPTSLSFAIVLAVCALDARCGGGIQRWTQQGGGQRHIVAVRERRQRHPLHRGRHGAEPSGGRQAAERVSLNITGPNGIPGVASARSTRRHSVGWSPTRPPPARRWRPGRRPGTIGSRWDPSEDGPETIFETALSGPRASARQPDLSPTSSSPTPRRRSSLRTCPTATGRRHHEADGGAGIESCSAAGGASRRCSSIPPIRSPTSRSRA